MAGGSFSEAERAILHSLAEMFQDKEDRDELRRILDEGVSLREIILAYKTDRRLVKKLKAWGTFIVLLASVGGALKAISLWIK